jgi:hypothetical protein
MGRKVLMGNDEQSLEWFQKRLNVLSGLLGLIVMLGTILGGWAWNQSLTNHDQNMQIDQQRGEIDRLKSQMETLSKLSETMTTLSERLSWVVRWMERNERKP